MSIRKNVIAFFIIGILGTLGHFIYEWSGKNLIVGYFFSVNESTWEHLKLLFFPTVIYSVFEYTFLKEKPTNYIPAVVISLVCGMLTIVTLFYTINGILGYNIDFVNIAIYYISIIVMLIKREKIIREKKFSLSLFNWFFILVGLIIAISFVIFTYNPLSYGIFTKPN